MNIKDELSQLIAEGYEVKERCYKRSDRGDAFSSISGAEYVTWLNKGKIFVNKNVTGNKDFVGKFTEAADQANGYYESSFDTVVGMLKALEVYDFSEVKEDQLEVIDDSIDKIFISHASKDVNYVEALVDLLNNIGIAKDSKNIFCSSLAGYDIPHGENIYDFLKKELNNSNIMVLFVLSHNYYQSAPCLNEMGAAWITSKRHSTVLTPNFDFKHIGGAINPTQITFKLNDKDGLNKFKDDIVKTLNLDEFNYKFWERDRDKFLKAINSIATVEASTLNTNVTVEKVKKQGENHLELQLRFKNITDKDIEVQYLDIELVDQNGSVIKLSAEDEFLDDFILYSQENKVEKWIFKYDETSGYNPRRNDKDKIKVNFSI
ncbi:toll/interleukin-1 receptor domain-containing protein [Priestia megaterium]|uniref:toll/interleukin-1 receptor domain-containing protein n=1 Tax=Priestia megaterium TaxID=1404 RepID=UPI00245327E2|nr:toll/interleukin-1 receptor domain-containing protein [Priestia megaterium]MDH3183548.1 toll/interleukin-1 receptor domain-containing protein [Priestia megaterium]MDH3183588.1 toll/interleukin-1 receptor domain-containing protein [Priestia megaterium]